MFSALTDTYGSISASTISPSTMAMKRDQFRDRISTFLIENKWIDEMLAIKLGSEVREWSVLERFCEYRGLQRQLMNVITSIFKSELKSYPSTEYALNNKLEKSSKFVYSTLSLKGLKDVATKMISDMPMRERRGFLNCLVNSDNLIACIDDPELSIDLIDILHGALPFLDECQLEKAIIQAEPRRCGYIPVYLYPLLLKSSHYFVTPATLSSSAPPSMTNKGNSINKNHQDIPISGYQFAKSMLNFYVSAQLLLVKTYIPKCVNNRSLSPNPCISASMEASCCDNVNPPKMSSCDVNLVKMITNVDQVNDRNDLIQQFLLKQSSCETNMNHSSYRNEIECDGYFSKERGRISSLAKCDPTKRFSEEQDSNISSLEPRRGIMKVNSSLLATGPTHVLIIRPRANIVMSWGSVEHGALGHPHALANPSRYSPPREVSFLSQLNHAHSLSKPNKEDETDDKEDANLFQEYRDDNAEAKLLDNQEILDNLSPPITAFSVACGKTHSLALTDRGIYAWGSSKYGQLGLGVKRQKTKRPEVISTLSHRVITDIACGHYHSVALDVKGRLWTWGWGVHGQLGHDNIEDECVPKRLTRPQQLLNESICRIAAGYAHTMVSTMAGNIWVFGCGLFGQLGNGENKKSTIPIRVDFSNTINSEGVMNDKMGIMTCGYFHNFSVSQDGLRLYTWGCNPQVLRQEAQQKKKERLQTVLTGKANGASNASKEGYSSATPGTRSKSNLNDHSATGGDEEKINNHMPSETKGLSSSPTSFHEQKEQKKEKEEHEMLHLIPSLLDTSMIKGKMVDVACGNQHSLVLSNLGMVYAFGRNLEGQLGIGSRNRDVKVFTPISSLSDDFIVSVSSGGDYSAALSDSGTLFCWGHNSSGQLGKSPIMDDNHGGKTEIIGSRGKVMLLKTSKLNSKLTKFQHGTNYGILQNSCDIPKPILGLNSGVYSDERMDRQTMNEHAYRAIERLQHEIENYKKIRVSKNLIKNKLDKSRLSLHGCIEAFYPHLDHKKLIKKCLVSDNPQAAAKLSLLSGKILQAFEFTLQSLIKQTPRVSSDILSKNIFEAYHYYVQCKNNTEKAEDKRIRWANEKKQLTERLIVCWQDQNFSFTQLESLLLEKADPRLLQVLVLTLFCPDEERDTLNGPLLSSSDVADKKLVDLFTPEFCLNIGDTFVQNVVDQDPDEGFVSESPQVGDHPQGYGKPKLSDKQPTRSTCGNRQKMVVSKWLERQRSKDNIIEDEHISKISHLDSFDQDLDVQDCTDFDDTSFSNIEDMLDILPDEFYASKDANAKEIVNDPSVEQSQLTNLVTDLILEHD